MRTLLPSLACLAALLSACGDDAARAAELGARLAQRGTSAGSPDFLLVTIDTLRQDTVSAYGYPRESTPAFDALAEQGALFASHYTVMAHTGPVHATLFSGLYPREHGMRKNGTTLPEGLPWIVDELRRAGYRTGGFVGASVLAGRKGFARGFDVYDEDFRDGTRSEHNEKLYTRPAEDVVDRAIAYLAQPSDRPLFLWVHVYDPHAPREQHEGFEVELDDDVLAFYRERAQPGELVSLEEILAEQHDYESEVRYTDHHVGRLLDAWDAAERGRAGLVIVTSDHGEGLGEHDYVGHGFWSYEEQLRVPLAVRMPERIRAGSLVDAPTSAVDLAATCLDLLGLAAESARIGGASLARYLEASSSASDVAIWAERRVFAEADLARRANLVHILTQRANEPGVTRGDQIALTRDGWKYIWSEGVPDELYYLPDDPLELQNLAVAERERTEAMRAEVLAWRVARERDAFVADEHVDAETERMLDALGY